MTPESRILINRDGAPIDPVGGYETEYAALVRMHVGDKRWLVSPAGLLHRGYEGNYQSTDSYGADGSRRLLDVGDHPEYSTAEDNIFLMAAYRVLWGHRATADNLERGASIYLGEPDNNVTGIAMQLFANLTDYKGSVWGRHNNLLWPRAVSLRESIPALVAHRSSRIVWSGSGYVRSPDGNPANVQRCLSERAEFIEQEVGWEDTEKRSLVHTRDEALCDGELYRRMHDTAGDSVFAPNVNALLLASEAMIARAIGLGIKYDDLKPVNGPNAMRKISRDITLQQTVEVGDRGQQYTGVQLQREIAERTIGALAAEKLMTTQDKHYEAVWLDFLDKLATGQFMTGDNNEQYLFDWVPKLEKVDLGLSKPRKKWTALQVAQILALRYHQILPVYGYGMELVRDGKFPESPDEALITHGPALPDTRAKVRGDAVRRLIKKGTDFTVDWYHLRDNDRGTTLLLRDPFASQDGRVEALLRAAGA